MITALYAGILAIFMVVLLLRVARMRFKHQVGLGHGGNEEVTKAVRVHGNFVEMVPMILLLMFLMETQLSVSETVIHGFGIALIFSRLLHAIGLSKSVGTSAGRFLGTITAVLLLLVGGLICLYHSFM